MQTNNRNEELFERGLTDAARLRRRRRGDTLAPEAKGRLVSAIMHEVAGLSVPKPALSFWKPWGWILVGLSTAAALALASVYTELLEPVLGGAQTALATSVEELPIDALSFLLEVVASLATTDITALVLGAVTVIFVLAARPFSSFGKESAQG